MHLQSMHLRRIARLYFIKKGIFVGNRVKLTVSAQSLFFFFNLQVHNIYQLPFHFGQDAILQKCTLRLIFSCKVKLIEIFLPRISAHSAHKKMVIGIHHHHHRPHHHHDHRHDHRHHRDHHLHHHHHDVHQDHHEDQRHDGVIAVIARRQWCGEATQPQPSPEYNHLHLCQCLHHCHHCNHHHHLCQFLRHHLHLRQRLGHQLHRLFSHCLCISSCS